MRTVLVEGVLAAKAVNSAMESQQVDKMPEISGNKMYAIAKAHDSDSKLKASFGMMPRVL